MAGSRCVHGMDGRFCAICNGSTGLRAPRGSVGTASLSEILAFLNDQQIRATYGAVADVLGVIPLSMDGLLGPRSPEASWIVSAETGLPTGYARGDMHTELLCKNDVITSGIALTLRLAAWKAAQRTPEK